jgi:NAD(P)H-hydrate epimerase
MELAGSRAAAEVAKTWREGDGPVVILCGRGNNGGDGLVIARYLKIWRVPVSVFMLESRSDSKALARSERSANAAVVARLGISTTPVNPDDLSLVSAEIAKSSIVVDALLGTGLDRPVEGLVGQLIELINVSSKPVLAVDLPSGVNSDTGQVMGVAVKAYRTVTFGFLKAGLLSYPGSSLCGRITLVDIGLPTYDQFPSTETDTPQWYLSTERWVRSRLPVRPKDANKGSFGHLLTIAGSSGMSGAAILSSMSALRTGVGLSILATARSLVSHLPAQELIYRGVSETEAGTISKAALHDLEPKLREASAVVLGPGLSMHNETAEFVRAIVKTITKPCVIDADGLNAIAQSPEEFGSAGNNFVLTPHPKELSRLIGLTVAEIQSDRFAAAQKAARHFGCTVVLKGAHSIIAGPRETAHVNPTGNSGMATAGAGDVLSGIIGALLAQGLEPFDAAVAGAYVHGAAGDMAYDQIGQSGLIAGDVMSFIPAVMTQLYCRQFRGSELEKQLFGLD